MQQRHTAGKAGHRKIETTPEQMHWTDLAQKAGAKLLER
jgi:hypothetical protein